MPQRQRLAGAAVVQVRYARRAGSRWRSQRGSQGRRTRRCVQVRCGHQAVGRASVGSTIADLQHCASGVPTTGPLAGQAASQYKMF